MTDADIRDELKRQNRTLERREELLEEIRDQQERQAEALEVIAGSLLMFYDEDPETSRLSVEAAYEDAKLHGTGGEL